MWSVVCGGILITHMAMTQRRRGEKTKIIVYNTFFVLRHFLGVASQTWEVPPTRHFCLSIIPPSCSTLLLSLSPELYDNSSTIVSSSTTVIKKKHHHDGKLRTSKAQASPKDHFRVGRDDTTQRYQESHNSHVTLKSISTLRCIQR